MSYTFDGANEGLSLCYDIISNEVQELHRKAGNVKEIVDTGAVLLAKVLRNQMKDLDPEVEMDTGYMKIDRCWRSALVWGISRLEEQRHSLQRIIEQENAKTLQPAQHELF